jgi:hypothetical protein
VTCPDCGYMLSAFDKECPRCKITPPKPRPTPTPAPSPEPVAVATLEALPVAPAVSVSRPTSPVSIAASVICGILCVIGILLIVGGGIAFTHRRDPITAMNDDIQNTSIRGGYVSPYEADGERKIARLESAGYTEQSIKVMAAGGVFCLPMILFAASNTRRRKRGFPRQG